MLIAATVAHRAHLLGFARYARENNWHLVSDMLFTGVFPRGWSGDGILAVFDHQSEVLANLPDAHQPCVAIARADEMPHVPYIEEDYREIGRIAADHLLAHGYQSFAWAPMVDGRTNHEQFLGFRNRLAEYQRRCHVLPAAHFRVGRNWQCDWADYRQRLTAQLDQLPRPTAIFAFNDCVAANLFDACRDGGISVPEDFAILGAGNDPIVCESVPVPLSSIEPDYDQMAYRAAEVLDQLMNGVCPPAGTFQVAPKGIVTRVSTDVTAVSDPRIARALAFIAENYSDPMLSVLNVANAAGISRRNLERNFRSVTGHTIREHVNRTRMQEASRLLTNHPRTRIADVAALAGFAGTGNFYRTFRRYYGMSPQAHRECVARDSTLRIPLDHSETGLESPESLVASA